MKTLKKKLSSEDEIDLRKVFPSATDAIIKLVTDKLQAIQIDNNAQINI